MSAPSYQEFSRTKRFGSLDALRCISIIVVIFSHTAGDTFPSVGAQFMGRGGVRLFFAISGFLITTLLLRERDATGTINLRNFVIRRTLRIFPLYYTVLLIYLLLVLVTERHSEAGAQFFRNLPYFLTYTSNLFVKGQAAGGADRVLFVLAWSLATEEQFYLAWPAIEKFTGERLAAVVMLLLVAGLTVYRIAMADGLLANAAWTNGFVGVLIGSISLSICLGVLVAHALHTPLGFRLLAKIWTPFNSLIGLIALTALVIWSRSESLKSLASVFVVLSCVQSERHVLSGVFRWKPLIAIGVVSYGMYLMHLLCNHSIKVVYTHLHLPETVATPWIEFVGATVLTFIIATLSFRYYESIFLRFKHRFEPRRTVAGAKMEPEFTGARNFAAGQLEAGQLAAGDLADENLEVVAP